MCYYLDSACFNKGVRFLYKNVVNCCNLYKSFVIGTFVNKKRCKSSDKFTAPTERFC